MILLASWDDGAKTDLKMAELMKKYEIKCIFYWPAALEKQKNAGRAKSWLSLDECKEISKDFEIGSHSMTHQFMNKLDVERLANEITESRKFWQDQTGQPINSFAYPKNSINNLTKALIKGAGYTDARSSVIGHLSPIETFNKYCTVQIGNNRIEYNNKSWILFYEEMIQKVDENSIFHIFGNSWEIEENNEWQKLEDMLKRLKEI